jgi:hypothetical protein
MLIGAAGAAAAAAAGGNGRAGGVMVVVPVRGTGRKALLNTCAATRRP